MNCWAKIGEKFDLSAADAEKNLKTSGLVTGLPEEGFNLKVDSFGIWQE